MTSLPFNVIFQPTLQKQKNTEKKFWVLRTLYFHQSTLWYKSHFTYVESQTIMTCVLHCLKWIRITWISWWKTTLGCDKRFCRRWWVETLQPGFKVLFSFVLNSWYDVSYWIFESNEPIFGKDVIAHLQPDKRQRF